MRTLLLLSAALAPVALAAVAKRDVTVPSTLPGAWEYLGCYTDVGRTIDAVSYSDGTNMTDESCIAYCSAAGYQYAGTEYYDECYCGSSLAAGATLTDASDCSYPCTGNASEACGGSSLLTLFYSSEPVGPQPNPGVNGFNYVGCWAEGTSGRALAYQVGTIASDNMTVAQCTAACQSQGFILAGVEYASQCYCGNSIQNGGALATSTDCNMVCSGNSSEICGGPDRLDLYDYMDQYNTTGGSSPTTTTAGTGPATTTTSVPLPTDMPSGWTYQGCWIDSADGRVFGYQLPDSQSNTQELCAQECLAANYTVSGTEYGVQCFCGDYMINGANQTADADCNVACAGNSAEECGGPSRLTVWSEGAPLVYPVPAPQTTGLSGSWAYQGCLQDGLDNGQRTFFWQVLDFAGNMTANDCLDRCASFGYMAAGLEYGDECYCGDPENALVAGAQFVDESECNVVCAGDPGALCGGGDLLSAYYWTGPALYNWTFPQDPAEAGAFEFIVRAPTVALITIQSITGKVSFLSKGPGTAYGTETGAYELDLSIVQALGNTTEAWRTLHIKTDVFCAAGLVLPDKVGRQLTVGGWSSPSTYGMRLYWPDGSEGVWGTNDWQENVNELSLQAGRWYPTAMVMANGSIMVTGGEVDSNGAAVPSIEVIPYTGTAPLYMEWLDQTNPNNLYPFTAILPSGGIFVAYWNQARVLDPVTFDTIKTLPNMPGAVNDPTGGRTYPQEGAYTLLPQWAPYTDPLQVLVCGGSTVSVGNALDNCVLTTPDDDDAEWTIERLPSVRVIPAFAPLPDGTYLIVNGATHGWAGFGLANDPNYNAMIYDPTKPINNRVTVAANSTIARLYHNEAITLLDGRVLISGSDPQDAIRPEEYRVEVYNPPYLLNGLPRPSFNISNTDWTYGETGIAFSIGGPPQNGQLLVTLLGAVASTHGNSMGSRTLMPTFSCDGTACTVEAPPNANICPPGWYQMYVVDGGIPAVGTYVRIGGDPAGLGNWPDFPDFNVPGV